LQIYVSKSLFQNDSCISNRLGYVIREDEFYEVALYDKCRIIYRTLSGSIKRLCVVKILISYYLFHFTHI